MRLLRHFLSRSHRSSNLFFSVSPNALTLLYISVSSSIKAYNFRHNSFANIVIFLFVTLLTLSATVTMAVGGTSSNDPVRVGIFQNKPIVYFDNEPRGLFVEVLDYVAREEGWEMEYVTCELKDCINLLKSNELDLMTSFGKSPSRSKHFSYSTESIWTFWGTIYAHSVEIMGIMDLEGKKIGVRRKNKITTALQKLVADFNISVQYVEFDNYETAFQAFKANIVDAIAVNNTYGFDKHKEINSYKTPIVFNPFSAYFAVSSNNRHIEKLVIIDKHVKKLKADKKSFFYTFQKRWFGVSQTYWTGKRIGIIGAILLFVTVCAMTFWRYRSLVNINQNLIKSITRRKKTEKALRQSEAQLRTLINTLPDLVWLKDPDGVYLSCNLKFEKLFGAKETAIVGKTDYDFVDKELADFFREKDKTVMEICKPNMNEEEITYADDGHRELLETIKTPMLDSDGRVIGVLGVGRDITDRKRMQEELFQAQKMEAIGTLAGGIAHDFNNILSIIIGYTELAKYDAQPGSRHAVNLEKVFEAGNRAKELVKQILAFSRQEEISPIPMQLQSLIKEALKMLRSSIPTIIEIRDDIDSKCGVVLADPTQAHQILMNLCTNANHAMEETGGILRIQLKNTSIGNSKQQLALNINSGEYVELIVSDTGSGIGSDVIDKIFEPYFTTKERGKGTGMGLSIVHGIITDYGGGITVESKLGKGTAFHVYFPTVAKEELLLAKDVEKIPLGSERILFVDDEELLAKMGKDMLARLGYDVTAQNSSLEALAIFQNNPNAFDVVITDQTMPGMTGADLSKRILQIRPDIPIILCTGYSNLIDEDSAKVLGIKEFVLKPLTNEVIAKLIRKVLNE